MLKSIKWPDSWTLYWFVAGALAGCIVHIATVLALPHVATTDAWTSFANKLPTNQLRILPLIEDGKSPIPLMAPDVRYAACKFDLGKDQVRFRTELIGGAWSIALYTSRGANYYTISGAELQRSDIEMVLTLARDQTVAGAPVTEGAKTSTVTVAVPERQGLLLLRAPIPSPAYEPETKKVLAESLCFSSSDNQS